MILAAGLAAAAREPADPPGSPVLRPDTARVHVPAPSEGRYFLEMEASVPSTPGSEAIRHAVFLDGKQVMYQPEKRVRGRQWNVGYVPYFTSLKEHTLDGRGENASTNLLFMLPVDVSERQAQLEVHPAPGYSIQNVILHPAIQGIDASVRFEGGVRQVYFTGEKPVARVKLTGPPGSRATGRIVLQRLWLSDVWVAGSRWGPDVRMTESARLGQQPVDVRFSSDSTAVVAVALPDDQPHLVGLSVILEEADKRWAKYLGAAAVVPRRDVDRFHEDGPFISSFPTRMRRGRLTADDGGSAETLAAAYKRIGIDWVRTGPNWADFEPAPGKFRWGQADAQFDVLRTNGLTALYLANIAPEWAQPRGDNLLTFKYKNADRKSDWAPAKEHLDDWRIAHEALFRRYKDVIRACNVWNEPWEGMGITGWASTGEHYRKLVAGIRQAVQAADSSIKVVAADSGHNTDIKLFAAGMQDAIDVISTHYSSPHTSSAFAMKRHYDKELWETETWTAWHGDAASARHALYYFANGGDKVSLWNAEMLFDHEGNPTPATVWTAVMRHMLDGLHFSTALHPERPPFVLLFTGKDRQVATVSTRLSGDIPGAGFRDQFAFDQVSMHLEDDPAIQVFDLQGNALELQRENGKLVIPVDCEPRYIMFKGSSRDFEERLSQARYEGLRPVEITMHDITSLPEDGASLRITLRNAYPFATAATVTVEANGLTFRQDSITTLLTASGQQDVAFEIASVREGEGNEYPVKVTVDTDQGTAVWQESVYVSVITRGSPRIDGDLADWSRIKAVPVRMKAGASASADLLQAWFPWEEFAEGDAAFAAEVAYAADSDNLYMMARVKDGARQESPSFLSGKSLHQFQNPPADHIYIKDGPFPGERGDLIQLALGGAGEDTFLPKYEVYPPEHPWHQAGSFIPTRHKYIIYPVEGGGAEILRVRTPEFYFVHAAPVDYAWLAEHSRLEGSQVVVKRLKDGYVYEAALPWTELKPTPHAPGDVIRLSMIVQDGNIRNMLEWARGRSIAAQSIVDFEPGWGVKWSSNTEWGFVE